LIWEDDYILAISSDADAYYVYDEDNTEESELLRRVSGAHVDEITALSYNDHLSLLATGSVDGMVCVWDFEMSRLEGILHGHSEDITGLSFLAPYPLLLTSSLDC